VEQIDDGHQLAGAAGATMKDIVASVQQVAGIMGDITLASSEQSAGIEQINQAIMQMDQVTQRNAMLVEQAAAAATSLQDQALKLGHAVSVFKLDDAQPAPSMETVAVTRATVMQLPARSAGLRNHDAHENHQAFEFEKLA
jgi:methyl-accepting chemotaxis protein